MLPASVDEAAVADLHRQFRLAVEEDAAQIVLDAAPVRHFSAAALALFVSLARELSRREPAPSVQCAGASEELAALLRVSGLDRTLFANG